MKFMTTTTTTTTISVALDNNNSSSNKTMGIQKLLLAIYGALHTEWCWMCCCCSSLIRPHMVANKVVELLSLMQIMWEATIDFCTTIMMYSEPLNATVCHIHCIRDVMMIWGFCLLWTKISSNRSAVRIVVLLLWMNTSVAVPIYFHTIVGDVHARLDAYICHIGNVTHGVVIDWCSPGKLKISTIRSPTRL